MSENGCVIRLQTTVVVTIYHYYGSMVYGTSTNYNIIMLCDVYARVQ